MAQVGRRLKQGLCAAMLAKSKRRYITGNSQAIESSSGSRQVQRLGTVAKCEL